MTDSGVESRLVQEIYDACVDPGGWERFLADLGREFGAISRALVFVPSRATEPPRTFFPDVEPELVSLWPELFSGDPDLVQFFASMREGEVKTTEEVMSPEFWERTSLYNEWARPQGLGLNNGLWGIIERSGAAGSFLGVARERARPPFNADECQFIARLLPHLARASGIQRKLSWAELRAGAAEEVLGSIGLGVILVDENGAVLHANRNAEQLLHESDGLRATRGRLHAVRPRESQELMRLLREAGATGLGNGGGSSGGVLPISRGSGRRPLLVTVGPIGRETAGAWWCARPAAVVLLNDPEGELELPDERLRRLFGLTPAEARLARLLGRGGSLASAAEQLGVTKETARKRLHTVFDKLDVRRQSDLVKLLLRGPGMLPELP